MIKLLTINTGKLKREKERKMNSDYASFTFSLPLSLPPYLPSSSTSIVLLLSPIQLVYSIVVLNKCGIIVINETTYTFEVNITNIVGSSNETGEFSKFCIERDVRLQQQVL